MGNAPSNVTSGVKNQVNSGSKGLYKFVDMAGGGLLVQLTKEALKSKDFTELDATILREVKFINNSN